MIVFDSVSKHFGTQTVLKDASFTVNPGEQMGFVGPNGAGKSTIFKLITGEEESDKGDVILPSGQKIGHLRQQLPSTEEDATLLEFVRAGCADILAMEQELHDLQEQLGEGHDPKLMEKIGDLQHEFEHRDGYTLSSRAEVALGGLGFAEERFSEPLSSS